MDLTREHTHVIDSVEVPATYPTMPPDLLSLYLHIPFCQVRCAYCDFNTYAGLEPLMAPYATSLAREIRAVGRGMPTGAERRVHTIFFGGGTPSLLPLAAYADVFAALQESFELTADCEITLEANPGTVDERYLAGLRTVGVNRLSFGVQSSHAWELKLLDRLHTF
jgi:oxygen-independent coproporphyrinogen-3 oxidase